MKASVLARLVFGVLCACFIFVSATRANLELLLAPLPPIEAPEPIAAVAAAPKAAPKKAVSDPVGPRIGATELREAILQALQDSLRPNGELTFSPLRDLPNLSGYAQPFALTLLSAPSRLTRGNMLLRFQVENEKGVLGEWSIPFTAQVIGEAWVAKGFLRRGDMASPSDFEARSVDLLLEPEAVLADRDSLLRHEYSRDVSPGRTLVWKDLSVRSLVRKGEVVEVVAARGLMAITMRALARQDGGGGDIVVLRNLDSAKEFSARVVGENRVEVIF